MSEGGAGPDRWTLEKAVKASALPAPARLLMFVLLTHTSNGTLDVPPKFAPSLTRLADESGLSRRAVMGHLNWLESNGWLERQRPATKEALAGGARTSYRIAIPGQEVPQGRRCPRAGDALGGEGTQVRARAGDALGHEVPRGRAGDALNPTYAQRSSSVPTEQKKGGSGGNTSRRKKPETSAPEIFPVTDEMRAWARDHKRDITVELDDQTERFLNHARQNDRRCRDWLAAWRNWILKAQDFADRDGRRAGTGTNDIAGYGARAAVNDITDWTIRT